MSEPDPSSYRLRSTALLHTPGLLNYTQTVWRSDPLTAEVMLAEAFPTLPYFLVRDLLEGRVNIRLEDADTSVVFTWAGPIGQPTDYLPKRDPHPDDAEEVDEEDEEAMAVAG